MFLLALIIKGKKQVSVSGKSCTNVIDRENFVIVFMFPLEQRFLQL